MLHGVIQQQMALIKRERKILARKLETDFNKAFTTFQNNATSTAKIQLEKNRLEYDLFLTESADKSLRRSKHAFYMKSNKPNTLLASALKSIDKQSKSIRLKLSNNNYTSNPLKIVPKFCTYLSSLYSTSGEFNQTEADSFFFKLNLPVLTHTQRNLLEEQITIADVLKTIKELKLNKRPGPDCY